MKQRTSANLSIISSILIVIGFFLPWFTLSVSIEAISERVSYSMNGLQVLQTSDRVAAGGILLGAIISFILALTRRSKTNRILKFLQGSVHLGKGGLLLWSYLISMVSGEFRAEVQQGFLDEAKRRGIENQPWVRDAVNHLIVHLGTGFWIVAVGLLLLAIAIYAPRKEQQEAPCETTGLPERPLVPPSPAPTPLPARILAPLPCEHLAHGSEAHFCNVCGVPVPPSLSAYCT